MVLTRNSTVIAVALVVACAGQAQTQTQTQTQRKAQPSPPSTQPNSPLDRRGTILNQQTTQRNTSSANQRYALPQVKIRGLGVKASAPRGIGKKGGVLLPPPVDSPAPAARAATAAPSAGVRDADPWDGELRLDRYGRVTIAPGRKAGPPPNALVDPEVLASGDNVKIARMLRPAVDYSFLSRYDQFLMSRLCLPGMSKYFRTHPNPYTFSPDTITSPDSYVVDTRSVDPFVRNGNAPGAAPPAPVDPDDEGLTAFEKAGNRLFDGKPNEAIVLLRTYTEAHPGDAEAARALALALIDARRTKEGVELMGQVYEQSPALATLPIPPDAVGTEAELRDVVVRVVEHAHKVNTAGAWLTAAMLMQGEGRLDPALKMLDRADSRGLNPDLSRAMRAALKP